MTKRVIGPSYFVSDADCQRMRQLRREGYSYDKIAILTKRSQVTVLKWLGRHGKGEPMSRLSRVREERIVALATKIGANGYRIAKTLGEHPSTVWRVLKRNGIETDPNRWDRRRDYFVDRSATRRVLSPPLQETRR